VLLLADIAADQGGGLAGQQVAAVHQPGLLRVIALHRPGSDGVDWSPAPDYVIGVSDRVLVLATRAGLSGLLRAESPSTYAS
jgi:Trk K+ transport system NAD-binding subunit